MCVCVSECVCVRDYVCVCVCERERERERGRQRDDLQIYFRSRYFVIIEDQPSLARYLVQARFTIAYATDIFTGCKRQERPRPSPITTRNETRGTKNKRQDKPSPVGASTTDTKENTTVGTKTKEVIHSSREIAAGSGGLTKLLGAGVVYPESR